jgi:hypothetical protein
VQLLTGLLLILQLSTGSASQYARGVMQSTIQVRQNRKTSHPLPQTIPDVNGFVATQDCDLIGDIIWLRPESSGAWESFWVVDCASKKLDRGNESTYNWMLRNNILVEIDFETAQRWETIGRLIQIEMITPKERRAVQ